MFLCKYKNILGEPNKGVHSIRMFDIAIVDVILTVIAGVLISRFLKVSLVYVLIALFMLAIVMHRIFCVRTKVDRLLFGEN